MRRKCFAAFSEMPAGNQGVLPEESAVEQLLYGK